LYEDQGRYDDAVKVLTDAGMKSQSAVRGRTSCGRRCEDNSERAGNSLRATGACVPRSQENYPAAIQTFQEMGKLGADAQKRAEMLLIDTYRDSRDRSRHRRNEEGAGSCAERSKPHRNAGDAVWREVGCRFSDEAAAGIAAEETTATRKFISISRRCRSAGSFTRKRSNRRRRPSRWRATEDKGTAWFMLGAIYERQKKFDQAEQEFRKVLEASPGNAAVLNYYGYMLADRGVRLEEATSLISRP
jgi:tetratricopeptide (TPR) repeat protein